LKDLDVDDLEVLSERSVEQCSSSGSCHWQRELTAQGVNSAFHLFALRHSRAAADESWPNVFFPFGYLRL
jgi:hypothetical protein